ncbi:hypothetical protein APHWI1_0493 [Anaplasma phagocytophilum str. ApWI1]|uniref:Uncharacterized protein n=3 Tax=Anaplasma phagocytophilum TaxID=948 RepID=Q2GJA8_ANAPZ|nr:hypothetical protein APH_0978 [Anaplasma phagocytophilum str. HZ]AGR82093.1 hypothetical protein YYY_04505 [Anaplasma phagocytophilum str. Dog2]KJV60506.1 hypothetical protein APHWEB_1019 [Anaplasma phagocytophilum str. Webster]KJV62830.1 hypothetical protein EPHNCH_1311 [Anaplasma phagocytophilum str. NCH-1]KJV82506.1 hypothetical protein APHHGE2_1292 [Anaplasma phagocytophilum str. HGE2]KJV85477.1 hypothetical protein APHWI1_0493 [Anaplasma phagocytophilum str. ApWI1]KJV87128.1 hypotheti
MYTDIAGEVLAQKFMAFVSTLRYSSMFVFKIYQLKSKVYVL